jgi:hypothetical protein
MSLLTDTDRVSFVLQVIEIGFADLFPSSVGVPLAEVLGCTRRSRRSLARDFRNPVIKLTNEATLS